MKRINSTVSKRATASGEATFLVDLNIGTSTPLADTTLASVGLKERGDLQRRVPSQPELVGDGLLLVTSEFDHWEIRDQKVPDRRLSPSETPRIAELQANHLLRHFEIETALVPEEIVSELPRVRVVRDGELPVSGAAHWNGRYWIITINADEPYVRQRFSLMHEFKHVLDHTTKQLLYCDRPFQTVAEQAERVADYFAACVLMPKRVVKRLWCQGNQNTVRLAAMLSVSPRAVRFRLDQLGLTERTERCSQPATRNRHLTPSSSGSHL